MQKLNEEKWQQQERNSNFIVGFLVFVVAILSVGRIVIANQMVGASDKLRRLDSQIQKTQSENEILVEILHQKESLIQIESKAKSIGFVKTNHFSILTPPPSVAFKPITNSF